MEWALREGFCDETVAEEHARKKHMFPKWQTSQELHGWGADYLIPPEELCVKAQKRVNEAKENDEISFHTCTDCERNPCIWWSNRGDMYNMNINENEGDVPNNIRRRKLYRQMFLIWNKGPAGMGNRTKLPKCIEKGIRLMLPSDTKMYMGYRRR